MDLFSAMRIRKASLVFFFDGNKRICARVTASQMAAASCASHGKNVLGGIDSDGDNGHDFYLLVVLMKSRNSIMALSMPFAATSPQPRDGEVPFIR